MKSLELLKNVYIYNNFVVICCCGIGAAVAHSLIVATLFKVSAIKRDYELSYVRSFLAAISGYFALNFAFVIGKIIDGEFGIMSKLQILSFGDGVIPYILGTFGFCLVLQLGKWVQNYTFSTVLQIEADVLISGFLSFIMVITTLVVNLFTLFFILYYSV